MLSLVTERTVYAVSVLVIKFQGARDVKYTSMDSSEVNYKPHVAWYTH